MARDRGQVVVREPAVGPAPGRRHPSPARRRAAARISSVPLTDSGCPRRGPLSTTNTRSLRVPGGRVVMADLKGYIQRLERLTAQAKAAADAASAAATRPEAKSLYKAQSDAARQELQRAWKDSPWATKLASAARAIMSGWIG